jgi:hypothetical protein
MASLVVSVPLAGSGTTDSSVLGSLFVGIPLSGSGTTSSRATGFVADQFSGAGKGRSTASGTLTTWVYLHSDDGYGNSHVGSELAVYPLASILLATVGYVTRGTTSRGSGRLKRRITGTITDSGQVSPTSVFGVVEDEELVGEVVGVG